MPLISTFAAASARGYGQFTSDINLITVTFTANGTWTAPVGVGQIAVLSGAGSPGISDYTQNDSRTVCRVAAVLGTYSNAVTYTWQNLIDYCQGFANTMNAGSGVQAITVPNGTNSNNGVNINNANLGSQAQTTASGWNINYVAGGGNASLSLADFPKSGVSASSVITFADCLGVGGASYISLVFLAYIYGGPGNAASATFGSTYTFPAGTYSGGVGYPSVGATYNNIAVTPGNSYSIVGPSGGSVSISYFA
jgi:hypothetical protein